MTAQKKFKTFADLRLIPHLDETLHNQKKDPISNTDNSEESNPSTNITSSTSSSSRASTTRTPSRTSPSNKSREPGVKPEENAEQSISPIRDFQKVPNSVTREIMPSGLFRGKSKQVYDYLYSITRGAINPKRATRKSRKEIQKGSGIGSMVTVDAALSHLESIGLIRIRSAVGSLIGNEYEIFTPEETAFQDAPPLISTPSTSSICSTASIPTGISSIPSSTSPIQILDELDVPFSSISSTTETIDNKDSYNNAKTFIKTKEEKFDDEPAAAFRSFSEKLNEAFKELTGKEATVSDEQKLVQLGELIKAELMEAASRTKMVSDPAAFLLTHLRRRLGVRSIKLETTDKQTEKGTASSVKPLKREIPLSDDEIQECPDCEGRLVIYPGGPGKGAVMCKHLPLIKAKQLEQ